MRKAEYAILKPDSLSLPWLQIFEFGKTVLKSCSLAQRFAALFIRFPTQRIFRHPSDPVFHISSRFFVWMLDTIRYK